MTSNIPVKPNRFLKFDLWLEALRLLDFQIQQKQKNRHFNTLSMFYYEQLGSKTDALRDKEYFTQRVSTGLFYGLSREFAVYAYPIPKSRLGLRDYKFTTYPLRALYYMVGLYIVQVSQEFVLKHKHDRPNIHSFYGGNLKFNEGSLVINWRTVWYRPHYIAFRNQLRREARTNYQHKLVMRLDISNYFDKISIRRLLSNLNQYVMPNNKQRYHFDSSTIQEITQFFQFVSRGQQGIPQSDNDVVSGYIGYLYLIFGELIIDDEIGKYRDPVETYSIIRYVDDIFISVTFKEGINEQHQIAFAGRLVAQVSEALFRKLELNMNPKTKLFWLSNDDEREDLLNEIRQVSPEYHFSEDDDETPENKVNAILNELNQLKRKPVDPLREYSKTLNEEILREVFDDRVDQLFNMDYFRSKLHNVFSDFNFDHVKVLPFEFLILILKNKDVAIQFRDYLLGIEYLTAVDTNLILRFLCQTEFADLALIGKLQQNDAMGEIMNVFRDADLYSSNPGYFNLSYEQVLSLLPIPDLLIQTKNRILCERREDFSPALNHLLNEFQSVCFYLDPNHPKQLKQYTSPELERYLDRCHVPSEVRNAIERLFNRRNSNTVSHPGEEYGSVWAVDGDEYRDYRNQVGQCLKLIIPL